MGRIRKWFEEIFENSEGIPHKCTYIRYNKKTNRYLVPNSDTEVKTADTAIKLAFQLGATEVHFINL